MPSNVFGHVEICSAHGVAWAKHVCTNFTKIVTSVGSFSRQLRSPGFQTALREAIYRLALSVEVRFQQRPVVLEQGARSASDCLVGDETSEFECKTTPDSENPIKCD